MHRWKNVTVVIIVLGVVILAFLTWYRAQYSMETVQAFTVNVPDSEHHLLIATQGSPYKNRVLEGVVEAAKQRRCNVQVIDISALSEVALDDWIAIVIMHTWEMGEPPEDVSRFVNSQPNHDKIIMLTTSGEGDLKMQGIDAITSASSIADAPKDVAEIIRRLDRVMGV